MSWPTAVDECLDAAAEATRQRILRDRRRVSPELRPVLDHVEKHFSESELNVHHLDRAVKLRRPLRRLFQREMGCGFKDYLTGLKRGMAEWLLEKTELPIRQIATGLKYSQDHNFSRDFRKWTGESPEEFRRARRDAEEEDLTSIETRFKASVGYLEGESLRRFLAWLEGQFPESQKDETTSEAGCLFFFRGQVGGREQAEIAWRMLRNEPAQTQRDLLRQEIRFASPALFELLSRKSREEGRRDRRRGVELAELALASIEGSAAPLGARFQDLRVLALARLGHAHRLASDFDAAEECFERAATVWQGSPAAHDPRAEVELCLYEGSFRLFQRRYDDALGLLNRSLAITERLGEGRLRAECLLQRAAVMGHRGCPEVAVSDSLMALRLAGDLGDSELSAFAYHDLAKAYVDTGDEAKAESALREAEALYRELDQPLRRHQLRWIEGQLRRKLGDADSALSLWSEALAGFQELGEWSYAAEVSLELAVLHHRLGRAAEVVELVISTVIPVFERLRIRREAVAALRLLREAVAAREVRLAVLRRARECLRAILEGAEAGRQLCGMERTGP